MKDCAASNRAYRVVWSRARGVWMVVGELAKGLGKGSGRKKHALRGLLMLVTLSLFSSLAVAAPAGGAVTAGTGSISQSGSTTTIHQSSQNLSLSWKSFNVGSNETVSFNQPNSSAVAVNRIADANASQIMGHINANGNIYLINPNGIVFGATAQVNVGGLVASTLDTADGSTFSGNGTGAIVNKGTINAAHYVALLGNSVTNSGVITARLGTVAMGAGSDVSLSFSGNSLVKLMANRSVIDSLVANHGLIEADGGMVIMNAGARDTLLASVVNNDGIVQAQTVSNHQGTITLLGGMQAGTVNVGGTLDASAPSSLNPEGGNGGSIETSAAHVHVADNANISTASTSGADGTWLIDPVDFTIAASGGDMTGATLSNDLNAGSVTIQSGSGSSGTNGDIYVNDAVSWSANTKLTLNAYRNIVINQAITASGHSGQVALDYGQGAVAAGNTASYSFGLTNSGFAGQINLQVGTNFFTKLGSDGTLTSYNVITSLGSAGSLNGVDLQGMNGDLAGNYVLGANIDASATSSWNSGKGFTPVGGYYSGAYHYYSGAFDGLGHTISNLTINSAYGGGIALFGANTGAIRNVGLVNASVTGNSGNNVGALVGFNSGGTVSYDYASGGSVTGNTRYYVGGLVGNSTGTIGHSYASASVTGDHYIGGLAGQNTGTVSTSHASGSVTGTLYVGGLLGYDTGAVSNAYATGSVQGYQALGGLVGRQGGGSISTSYATGSVTGDSTSQGVGGLVGYQVNGSVSTSYATGSASGNLYVGGLVGYQNAGTISTSYATGSAAATTGSSPGQAGGLVGLENGGTISTSYAIGKVTAGYEAGGLVGNHNAGTASNSYWDITTSGVTSGAAFGSSSGMTGLSDSQMQQSSNFTGFDFTNTWVQYNGHTDPLLRSLMTALTVTAGGSKTYDGTAVSGLQGLSYSLSNVDTSHLYGTAAVYSNTGMVNAGSYSGVTVSGLYSDQQGYIISYGSAGTVTINKAVLTVTANNASKIDNGFAYSGGNGVSYTGFVHGEGASVLGGRLSYRGSAQGAINPGSYIITPYGLTAANYAFNYVDGTLTIGSVFQPTAADVDADTAAMSLMNPPLLGRPGIANAFLQMPPFASGASAKGLSGEGVPMPVTTVQFGDSGRLNILGGGLRLPSDSI